MKTARRNNRFFIELACLVYPIDALNRILFITKLLSARCLEEARNIARDITDEFLINGINISFCWFTSRLVSHTSLSSKHSGRPVLFSIQTISHMPLVDMSMYRCLMSRVLFSSPITSPFIIIVVVESLWKLFYTQSSI